MDAIERIAAACGKPKRTRRGWLCCCVGHDDRSPSMELVRGQRAILVKCYAGCDPRNLIDELRSRGFDMGRGNKRGEPRVAPVAPALDVEDRGVALARAVWAESVSARGSPVEYYLAGRGLVLPAEVNGAVIRFHPRCLRGKERAMAMVTALRDAETDRLIGIHRTYITRDYRRIDKMMLGRAGVAKLASHDAVLKAGRLTGCEGIETGLALIMQGCSPVWAFGSAGSLARCPLLPGVEELRIACDNDRSRTGWRVAQTAYWRWTDAGRVCEMRMVDRVGADFADLEASA